MIDQVKEILAKQLRIEADKISADTNIIEDLGADSLDVVEMLLAIDEAFGVNVPDEDVAKLKTVQDIADYVAANKK